MTSTPRSNDAGVEVDALITLVGEMTALKREVNGQVKNLEVTRAEIEHMKHHRRHTGEAETASQAESEEGEAQIDNTGRIHRGRDVYCFNESVWDATVFLGLVDGVFESADMVILGVLNVAIQGYFCYLLVNLGLVTLDNVFIDDLSDFVDWRLGVAHQAQNYDPITKSSMAQRICHEYGGTILARDQQSQFETFHEFFDARNRNESDWFQGAGLLTLALLLWLALILKEVVNIFGFCRMLVALSANDIESRCCGLFSGAIFRNSSRTRITKGEDGQFELLSLSRKRALSIFTFVALPRTTVAAILGVVGVYYLRATTSVEEIILNAMALGFVLEIDELLFCFAPSAARSVVSNMQPVTIEIDSQKEKQLKKAGTREVEEQRDGFLTKCFHHISERSRVLLVLLVAVVIICRVTLIRQLQDSMKIAQVLLCDGNLSFVFTENPSTGVLEVSYTADIPKNDVLPLPVDDLNNVFSGVVQATELCTYFTDETKEYKEIIERLGLCAGDTRMEWCDTCDQLRVSNAQLSQIRADVAETVAMTTQSDAEVRASMACVNLFSGVNMTEIYRPFQDLLQALNFTGEVGACEDMFQHCYHSSTQVREIVRLFCPETCLCNAALQASMHPNPWYFNRVGCVPSCGTYITATEFVNFEQDLLIAGESDCYDRDVLEPRETFLPLVADVVEYLVSSEKLLEHTGDDGITRYTPHPLDVVPVFTSYTQQDYTTFQTDYFETSLGMLGCSFVEGANTYLNLTDWYAESNGLCHWTAVVSYVFNINLCSQQLLDDGYTSVSGLCPVTCSVGICAAIASTPKALQGLVGDSQASWFNLVGWSQAWKYNVTCDAENFMCIKVVQFHSEFDGGWFDLWLDIDEFTHGSGNASLIYEGYGNSAVGSETRYACTRRNLTHPSNFSVEAYGWDGRQAARKGVRWQLRDMSDNHLITAGWNRQYSIVGYDWQEVFQQTCEQEDVVTYMGSLYEIQTVYWLREAWGFGDTRVRAGPTGEVEYARRGMFSWQTAIVLGDYSAEDDTVVVLPTNQPWSSEALRVDRGRLGVPQVSNATTFQDYKSCAVGSSLLEIGESPMVNGICGSTSSCFDTVQKLQCDVTAEMLVSRLQALGACADPVWDLAVVNRTTKLRDICPEQCESQADQTKCPQQLLNSGESMHGTFDGPFVGDYYFAYYYSFQEPMCMPTGCRCLDPRTIIDQCSAEFFTLEHPFYSHHSSSGYFDQEKDIWMNGFPVEYRGTLENATRLLSRNTSCFWASEGLWHERQPIEPEGPWCLVDVVQCDWDAFVFQEFPVDYEAYLYTSCGWRPAYEEYECQIDPRDVSEDWFLQNYFFVVSETTTTTHWWQTTGGSYCYGDCGSSGPYTGGYQNYDYYYGGGGAAGPPPI